MTTTQQPVVLDLFCGAGGAAMGYHQTGGLRVRGVDKHPMPNYPFEFQQANALQVLVEVIDGQHPDVVGVHASPPCQALTSLTTGTNRITKAANHVNLIPVVRELLELTGLPYVIENVQGSQLRRDVTLCGLQFGLQVFRHRYFELGGWTMPDAYHPADLHAGHRVAGWRHGTRYDGDMFAVYGDGGGKGTVQQWQQAMGIDWTTDRRDLAEAIPPAYTRYIGTGLLRHLEVTA